MPKPSGWLRCRAAWKFSCWPDWQQLWEKKMKILYRYEFGGPRVHNVDDSQFIHLSLWRGFWGFRTELNYEEINIFVMLHLFFIYISVTYETQQYYIIFYTFRPCLIHYKVLTLQEKKNHVLIPHFHIIWM